MENRDSLRAMKEGKVATKLAGVGDIVEVKVKRGNLLAKETFGGFRGVVFGISSDGLAQVQWVTKDYCGLTVHWSRHNLKVVKPNPFNGKPFLR